jgi:hypothetical protein
VQVLAAQDSLWRALADSNSDQILFFKNNHESHVSSSSKIVPIH